MLQKSTLLILLIWGWISSPIQAQDCSWKAAKVNAPSGLILRKAPGSGFLQLIPTGDTVQYCADQTFGELSYEGISGYWRKVRYADKEGYSFDGFLEVIVKGPASDSLLQASKNLIATSDSLLGDSMAKAKPVIEELPSPHTAIPGEDFQFLIETYNYCGNVQEIDLQLYWFGVFMDDEMNPSGSMSIRPLDLNISLSKNQGGSSLEFDLLTNLDERSLFLFGVSGSYPYQTMKLSDVLPSISSHGKRLFPGQEWLIDAKSQTVLSATGSITKAGPCPEAENYTLSIRRGLGADEQKMDLSSIISDYGSCAIPEVYWYGDLSGDGLPEIIFVSVQDEQNVFYFLRSEQNSSQLFSLQAVYTLENCATPWTSNSIKTKTTSSF